jgi:hypothetical protein
MSSIIKFIEDIIDPFTKSLRKEAIQLPDKILPDINTKFYHQSCYDFEKRYSSKYVGNHPQNDLPNLTLISIFLLTLAFYVIRNMILVLKFEKNFYKTLSSFIKDYNEDCNEDCKYVGNKIVTRFRRNVSKLHLTLFLYYTLEFFYIWTHLYYLKILKKFTIIIFTVILIREIEYLKSILEEMYIHGEIRDKKSPSYLRKLINSMLLWLDPKIISIMQFISVILISLLLQSDLIDVLVILILNLIILTKVIRLNCVIMQRLTLQPFIFCMIATILFIIDYFYCKSNWTENLFGKHLKPNVKAILNLIFRFHINFLITFFMTNIFLMEFYKYLVGRVMMLEISTNDLFLFAFIKFDVDIIYFRYYIKHLIRLKENIVNSKKLSNAKTALEIECLKDLSNLDNTGKINDISNLSVNS